MPNRGSLPDEFPYSRFKKIPVDVKAGTAEFRPGMTMKLTPFWGSIGVAPPLVSHRISSGPPGSHGGNLDNKELVAGSILYLPVQTPGALLSMGDGHGLQGDGEVTLTALETSLRGSVQIFVRKGKAIRWPRAETPAHFIAMGLNPDLDEAARMAIREMIDFLVAEKGLSRDDAYIFCSMGVDLHVTQLVDDTKGVHAMLPKAVFR
jgi:acetamidase/formamidase